MQVVRLQTYSMGPSDVKKKKKTLKNLATEQQLLFLKMHLIKKHILPLGKGPKIVISGKLNNEL